MSARVPLTDAPLPYSPGSIYVLKARHGWTWLSRSGPAGVKTKFLWVDLRAAANWFADRGRTEIAEQLAAKAVEIELKSR